MTIPFINTSDQSLFVTMESPTTEVFYVVLGPYQTGQIPEGYTIGGNTFQLGDVGYYTGDMIVRLSGPQPVESLALGAGFGFSLVAVCFMLWGVQLLRRPVIET